MITVNQRMVGRYRNNQFNEAHLLFVALTWKGSTNGLGWQGLSPILDDQSRAELGYILGCRFAKQLAAPDGARLVLTDALKSASPGSNVANLIEAELNKLTQVDNEPTESVSDGN